jgi:hypothetical protein
MAEEESGDSVFTLGDFLKSKNSPEEAQEKTEPEASTQPSG